MCRMWQERFILLCRKVQEGSVFCLQMVLFRMLPFVSLVLREGSWHMRHDSCFLSFLLILCYVLCRFDLLVWFRLCVEFWILCQCIEMFFNIWPWNMRLEKLSWKGRCVKKEIKTNELIQREYLLSFLRLHQLLLDFLATWDSSVIVVALPQPPHPKKQRKRSGKSSWSRISNDLEDGFSVSIPFCLIKYILALVGGVTSDRSYWEIAGVWWYSWGARK